MKISPEYANQPALALTPLYHFQSDSSDFRVGDIFRVARYDSDIVTCFSPDDMFVRHLQLCEPEYLLWQGFPVDGVDLSALAPHSNTPEESIAAMQVLFL